MKTKAQSITEYILVLGIITMALVTMQLYFRRGIQAAIKATADEIGTQGDAQEIDPQRGTRTNSSIERFTSGPRGGMAFQRTELNRDGTVRSDFDSTTEVTGSSTYRSEREE